MDYDAIKERLCELRRQLMEIDPADKDCVEKHKVIELAQDKIEQELSFLEMAGKDK